MRSRPGEVIGSKDGNHDSHYGFAFIKSGGYVKPSAKTNGIQVDKWVGPTDGGYNAIYTSLASWIAVKPNGEVFWWGSHAYGMTGCPILGCTYASCINAGVDSYYPKPIKYIYISAANQFCALYADTTAYCWKTGAGSEKSPPGTGWVTATVSAYTIAFLNKDGSLWSQVEGTTYKMPTTGKFIALHSTDSTVIALSDTGALTSWGSRKYAGSDEEPFGYVGIRAGHSGFCALWTGGTIKGRIDCWDQSQIYIGNFVGAGSRPTDDGYVSLYSNQYSYVAVKADGTARPFGWTGYGGLIPASISPNNELQGVARIVSNVGAYVAVKTNGSLVCWGTYNNGGAYASGVTLCPTGTGYTEVSSSYYGFAALDSDGAIVTWGLVSKSGSTNVLRTTRDAGDVGYVRLYMLESEFAAQKADGRIRTFGNNAVPTTDSRGNSNNYYFTEAEKNETGWVIDATKGMFSSHNQGLLDGEDSECGGYAYGNPYANVYDMLYTPCSTVPNSTGNGHVECIVCKPAAGYANGTYAQEGEGLSGYSGSFEGKGDCMAASNHPAPPQLFGCSCIAMHYLAVLYLCLWCLHEKMFMLRSWAAIACSTVPNSNGNGFIPDVDGCIPDAGYENGTYAKAEGLPGYSGSFEGKVGVMRPFATTAPIGALRYLRSLFMVLCMVQQSTAARCQIQTVSAQSQMWVVAILLRAISRAPISKPKACLGTVGPLKVRWFCLHAGFSNNCANVCSLG